MSTHYTVSTQHTQWFAVNLLPSSPIDLSLRTVWQNIQNSPQLVVGGFVVVDVTDLINPR